MKNLSELNKKISNIEINPKEILFMQFEKIVEDKSDDLKNIFQLKERNFYILYSANRYLVFMIYLKYMQKRKF